MDSIKIEDFKDMPSDDDIIIVDAVHGHMVIPAVCKAVIDTYEFQRLRNIVQCGVANYVYPTANHSRFEHSLGVCYYSRLFMECLIKRSEGLENLLTPEIQLCIQLAGLCHDLGHGPFSHTWEVFINQGITDPNDKFKHEQMSKKIFEHIYNKYDHVKTAFKIFNIDEKVKFICDVITNENKETYSKSEQFLFQIIANKESGIDVDKLEYLKRDACQFGMKFSIDVFRIFNNARIIKNNGTNSIAYRDKIHGNIFDMFLTRAKMHYLCYRHPKCTCIENMLIDALIEANKVEKEENKLSERHNDLNEYLKLDDSIINRLKGEKANNLIHRIYTRDIYKLIHQEIIEKDDIAIVESIKEMVLKNLNSVIKAEVKEKKPEIQITENEIWFESTIIKLNLGQANGTDTDPLKNVNFYDKENKLIEDYSKMEKSFASRFYSKDSHFSCVMMVVYCVLNDLEFKKYGLSLDHCQSTAKNLFIQKRT